MCSAPETSREHVPPQCFFPLAKDIGRDLKRNLITVPSCDVHNSNKSKDDEYFRSVVLFSAAASNEIAKHQFLGKMMRAVSRKPHVYSNFFEDEGTFANGEAHAMRIDRERFDACVDHFVRAIFFYTYQQKWELPTFVISPNIYSAIKEDYAVPHPPTTNAVDVTREFLEQEEIRGENPEVFKYRIRYDEAANMYGFAAIFYDFFEIYSASSSELCNAAV